MYISKGMLLGSSQLLLTGLLFCSAGHAMAQGAGAQVASADAAIGNDIIVTATKRNERLQDVPVSIVALTPEALARSGTLTTAQLPNLTPGLSFTNSGQPKGNAFFARGVGTYGIATTLESSVGVAIDGVPLARISGSLADLVDIDHVEVLKGPQGMLFGKNATAGLVSIVTNKPKIGDNSFIGHVSYGSYNELNADATINISPSDQGAFRLTAWRYGHDGITRANYGGKYLDKNTYGARLGVTVAPTETLTVTVTGEFNGRDENGIAQTLLGYGPVTDAGVIAYHNSIGYLPNFKNDAVARLGFPGYVKGRNLALTSLIDLELGSGYTLSSVTSYRDVVDDSVFDTLGTDTPTFNSFDLLNNVNYHQFTQELRIASPKENRLSFVAGLFFYDFAVSDIQNTGLAQNGSRYDRKTALTNNMKDYAVFGEATFRVLDKWRLIAGARQSHDRTVGTLDRTRVGTDSGFIPPIGITQLLSFQSTPVKYDFTSYRFGTQVDIARDVMFYATASRGYKGPGFNLSISTSSANLLTGGVPNNALVDGETVNSYEAGIKSQFFNRRLTINVTGFHSVFKNFQTTTAPPVLPQQFIIANAGELTSDGVEFEVSGRPTRELSLGLNGAYINARFTDFKTAQCNVNQTVAGTCVGGVQNLNGVQLAASPKWSLNAYARYDMEFGSDWHGYVGGDYSYRSRQLYDNLNDPKSQQPGYGVFNFNAGFGPQSEKWTLSVYVRNAFEQYFVNRIRYANSFYVQYNSYEARRRIGAALEVKF